jgi:hypothetical protein
MLVVPPSHPSEWKVCSTNFASTKLSEVRMAPVPHNAKVGVLASPGRGLFDF